MENIQDRIQWERTELLRNIDNLQRSLAGLVTRVQQNRTIPDLGVVQNQGNQIDSGCAKLALLISLTQP